MRLKYIKFISISSLICMLSAINCYAGEIDVSGGSATVPVELKTEVAIFSVTIPTSLPISVSRTGEISVASDARIINNSYGAVKVTDMQIEGVSNWEIMNWNTFNSKAAKIGEAKIAMDVQTNKTIGDDRIEFSELTFPTLYGKSDTVGYHKNEVYIDYDAKVPAQVNELTEINAVNVLFTIEWDKYVG